MTKVLKILGNIVGITLEWILFLLIVCLFLIRSESVQTYLGKKATAYLSKEWNTKVDIERISVVFLDRIAVDGVYIEDLEGDTLLYSGSLFVNISVLNLGKNNIVIDEIDLEQATVHVKRDSADGEYNYAFIEDYFSSGSSSGSKPLKLSINKLLLEHINFKYDDFRKDYSKFGMDFDHLDFKDVMLDVSGFMLNDDHAKVSVNSISLRERSGLKLEKLATRADISPQGIKLDELYIKTPETEIDAPKLHLLTQSFEDYQQFEDSVRFDAELNKSQVSLKDVSYFATALEGMDQKISLKAKVTDKIKNLHITDLSLETGKRTRIEGSLTLPDFRELEKAEFNEKLDYAYISIDDLKQIRMPVDSGMDYLSFDEMINRLAYVETSNLKLSGSYSDFRISSDKLSTALGAVRINNGITLHAINGSDAYAFSGVSPEAYDLRVEQFRLGEFLDESTLGIVDAQVKLAGTINGAEPLTLTKIEGKVDALGLNGYTYTNIVVSNGSFENEVFAADMVVSDPNLDMDFKGNIDLKNEQTIQFDLELHKANMTALGFSSVPKTQLSGTMKGDMTGYSLNTIKGQINVENLRFSNENDSIEVANIDLVVERNNNQDLINLESNLLAATVNGKIDFETVGDEILAQIGRTFPAFFKKAEETYDYSNSKNDFIYSVEFREPDKFMKFISPDLSIANNSTISGKYVGKNNYFRMNANSDFIDFGAFHVDSLQYKQSLEEDQLEAHLFTTRVLVNDSLSLDSLRFDATGSQNNIRSELSWDPGSINESRIAWTTEVRSLEEFHFVLDPSFFALRGNRWNIENASEITYAPDSIIVNQFRLSRDNQFLTLDGVLSRNDEDQLKFKINEFELDDIGPFIGSGMDIQGKLNGWGYISNPYTNLKYSGDASIENLYLNGEEVGNVFVQTEWDQSRQTVSLTGDLEYRNAETFKFDGFYDLSREEDNLDFNLVFDKTNIAFTNAFLDPDVVSDIDGNLEGRLKVTGSPNKPQLKGSLNIANAQARLALLGALFRFEGKIKADPSGFYINNMPVIDEEGNQGSVVGTIFHDNFTNWNFDVSFNLEDDARYLNDPRIHRPLNRFLVMNTKYEEGSIYYGRAYVTGTAEIFGYADQMEIDVDLTTQKDTKVNFPMYGYTEIQEENNYITFTPKDSTDTLVENKIDFTGIDLDLNFHVTPEAELKIVFDDQLNDEITAHGQGDINIEVDNLGDVQMNGLFTVTDGFYNFVMPPIKEKFVIQSGGTISWTGDPANAMINLAAIYHVNANLADIVPDQVTTAAIHQDVECYIYLSNTLTEPAIRFDIKVPKAAESNKALIARITSDTDELNKQFFSLLLFKRFQPLTGPGSAGNNAALDVLTNQINSFLSQVSKNYKLNVNVDSDTQTGEGSVEIGIQKNFLNERLRVTGNFGVENNTQGPAVSQNQGFIGDINIEYLLNDLGTFRISVFNESNTQTILQDNNQGLFTQGVGLTYQEDFNSARDFKVLQYFLNIFRSKKNKRYPANQNQRREPLPEYKDSSFVKPDEVSSQG